MERMTDESRLVALIRAGLPDRFEHLFQDALVFAQGVYGGARRNSGEPYFIHALNVAALCADMKQDTDSILAGLLHQTGSRRFKSDEEIADIKIGIERRFGLHVAGLIESLEQINEATKINKETNAAALTRYLLAGSQDIRPLLIKLADILDDTRTFAFLAQEKQKGFCQKVLHVYAPLAEYLNFFDIKNELEETAFKYLDPDSHAAIAAELRNKGITQQLKERYIAYFRDVTDILGYKPEIIGRAKGVYSVYNKIGKYLKEGKGSHLERLHDLLAFSIIVQREQDCYEISHAIQVFSDGDPDKYDDYIAHPKPNGYRALQIIVRVPDIAPIETEVQIMTYDMYHYNTYGPASHIAYKASRARFARQTSEFNWMEKIHRALAEYVNQRETERSIPITGSIFENSVFVFTPKGEIKEFARGDTALDFAYAIHEEIGHSATGARVNGARAEVSYELVTGDRVEILVQKGKTRPDRAWLGIAKTKLAREFIRKRLHALDKLS